MTHSNIRALRRYWNTEVFTKLDGSRVMEPFDLPLFTEVPAPPAKVGKQFPYKNARRELEDSLSPDAIVRLHQPHLKDAMQMQRQAAYLGQTKQFPKPASHKHGGDGTTRRSSMRRPFRGVLAAH